ncbi:MAG: response regulator transcription factor [Pirellulaceae bacterium]|nr:response regulator transcription factor [Pirellulaceae bacterium]
MNDPSTTLEQQVTRVLIVDDHELLRDGLRQLIMRQPKLDVCGEAANESEARKCFRQLQPDLVIVDLALQESSGLDLIKWIVKTAPSTKVIVSSMYEERDYGERVMRAGAVGYVHKQQPARTILTGIAQVLDGKLFYSEALSRRMRMRATDAETPMDQSVVSALSDRELEIFTLIGDGRSTEQIASRLNLSTNTIGTYRERLKSKLEIASAAELVRFATLWVTNGR